MTYFFERKQLLKFLFIDGDGDGDYDTIGEMEVTLGKILGAKGQAHKGKLSFNGSDDRGKVQVRAEVQNAKDEFAKWRLRWTDIKNLSAGCLGFCRKPVSYRCEIMKDVSGTGKFVSAVKIPQVMNDSPDVVLSKQTIPLLQLCNSNKDANLKFALISMDSDKELAHAITTLNELKEGNVRLSAGGSTRLFVDEFQLTERPTFLEYLRSGWTISMVCAIDYTASNGSQRSPDSLHSPGANNQYEAAIKNVGQVIEPYDDDKSFPVFGFGGIPYHCGIKKVSHCFALNGNINSPEIIGVEGIVEMYRETLMKIELSGPTLFAPLLSEFLLFIKGMPNQNTYYILLLLTDGTIHDMQETIDHICALADYPCSIIIVGVGDDDFSSMEQLDNDGGRFRMRNSQGKEASRDIVQFVEYNECLGKGDLAEQVLKEVPDQFCVYMERNNFKPPKALDLSSLSGFGNSSRRERERGRLGS